MNGWIDGFCICIVSICQQFVSTNELQFIVVWIFIASPFLLSLGNSLNFLLLASLLAVSVSLQFPCDGELLSDCLLHYYH